GKPRLINLIKLPRPVQCHKTAYRTELRNTPRGTRTLNRCLEDSRDHPFHHRGLAAVAVGVEPTSPRGLLVFETRWSSHSRSLPEKRKPWESNPPRASPGQLSTLV